MSGERQPEEPTADSVLDSMMKTALGADNPGTESAIVAAEQEVLRRLKRAGEILNGITPEPNEIYDKEAMAAVILIEREKFDKMQQQAEKSPWN